MTLAQMLAQLRATRDARIAARGTAQAALLALRARVDTDAPPTESEVTTARAARDAVDAEIDALTARESELLAEIERDDALNRLQRAPGPEGARGYDNQLRVTAEQRTYDRHKDPAFDTRTDRWRPSAKPGADFERDVMGAFTGTDFSAVGRLAAWQAEERIERAEYMSRAAGTGAFAGLTVPQYLTEFYAPMASAGRPFADMCNPHELPASGMTVNISRITTATSVALQSSENSAVSETDIDDTLLSPAVQTNSGQQTLSRQAIERGTGTEAVTLDDLYRRYATTLDSTLLNQATNGLTNVATAITYTDASPTVAELYPLFAQASAAVEASMLDMASGENVAVMHSRRWFWLQQAMSASNPLFSQPGIVGQMLGENYAATYGRGVRGMLPNSTPVIVDNNISTVLGGSTNQDEVYIVDRRECHLWEDPSAPLFIRAEQTKAASLGVLLVLYGYFAYTHARYAHAQKISGTGLVTPTWTGV